MRATMMQTPLTLTPVLRRAHAMFRDVELVTRRPDKRVERATVGDFVDQAARLAGALRKAGLQPGDRVATLMWNHLEHTATYFGVPCAGGVLHTLNLRLPPDDIAYIVDHAGDRFLVVDDVLLPLLGQVPRRGAVRAGHRRRRPRGRRRRRRVGRLPRRRRRRHRGAARRPARPRRGRGRWACATRRAPPASPRASSTRTARPCCTRWRCRLADCIGLVAARRALAGGARCSTPTPGGFPFAAAMAGAKLVMPGAAPRPGEPARPDGVRAGDLRRRRADDLVRHPASSSRPARPLRLWSAARAWWSAARPRPRRMIRAFDRHGLRVIHAWGMTETRPLGTGRLPAQHRHARGRRRGRGRTPSGPAGLPAPLVDIRAVDDQGVVPVGRRAEAASSRSAARGSRPATTRPRGRRPVDRRRLVPHRRRGRRSTPHGSSRSSTGPRTSSSAAASGSASVDARERPDGAPRSAEAAVIAVPHPKWLERPLAVVVLEGRRRGHRRRAARVPRAAVRQVPAPRRGRLRRRRSPGPRPARCSRARCASATPDGSGERRRAGGALLPRRANRRRRLRRPGPDRGRAPADRGRHRRPGRGRGHRRAGRRAGLGQDLGPVHGRRGPRRPRRPPRDRAGRLDRGQRGQADRRVHARGVGGVRRRGRGRPGRQAPRQAGRPRRRGLRGRPAGRGHRRHQGRPRPLARPAARGGHQADHRGRQAHRRPHRPPRPPARPRRGRDRQAGRALGGVPVLRVRPRPRPGPAPAQPGRRRRRRRHPRPGPGAGAAAAAARAARAGGVDPRRPGRPRPRPRHRRRSRPWPCSTSPTASASSWSRPCATPSACSTPWARWCRWPAPAPTSGRRACSS